MNIAILHDSELGNGERLANQIRDRLRAAGHSVQVGHERTLRAAEVIAARPDLVLLGTAVRKFSLSPVTKAWIDQLGTVVDQGVGPKAAVFVTHALKKEATDRKGARIRDRLASVLGEGSVRPGWISARVVGPSGPFHEGVEEAVMNEIDATVAWAAS